MSFKQVPANLGNYVVINDLSGDGNAGTGFVWVYNTSADGNTPLMLNATTLSGAVLLGATSGAASNPDGTVFKDLGVTYVQKSTENVSMQNVYRKVVKAADAASSATPTEYFIKVVNAERNPASGLAAGSVQFARLG